MNAPPQSPRTRTGPWQDRLGRASIRSLQALVVLSLAVVVVWVGVQLRLVVVPLLIAVLIAAAASPIVSWLNRRGLPRAPSVWATLLTGFAVLGGLVWAVARAARDQWGELAEGARQGVQELERFLAESPLGLDRERLDDLWNRAGEVLAGPQGRSILTGATLVIEILAGIFLGLVLLYFLLKDGARIWSFLRDELLPDRHAKRFDRVAEEAVSTLGGYVRGTALIALVEAVIIGSAVAILGVPLALPIAIVVFIGAFIPLLGATAAGTLAALIALVSNGVVAALVLVAVVIVVNQLEGDVLSPYVLGKTLSLHPLAVLLALSAGTISAGIIGAILAVPFAAVAWSAITTWRSVENDEHPAPAPDSA
ncbi:MAG TPA: AI-2E family transporter [Intrasporangium sp.]|uniref:AI-2E family transporter n=1 Tax=Intrasporangium sp. TaxID=1925024 RepID=UPI002B4780F8|nr:AI-2E family transporter [Intrasporangium sp.]HKX68334.1 AI-2E family transporter [Intrasporangium sp.]